MCHWYYRRMEQTLEQGTTQLSLVRAVRANIAGLPKAATWSGFMAGFLCVLISVTGPVALVFQAAQAGNLTTLQIDSWLFAIFFGSGLFGFLLTLRYGIPVIGAWGAATTALLVTSLSTHPLPEVIGAFFVASVGLIIVGISGLFGKFIHFVPRPVVMAMLAGVLFNFGVKVFSSMKSGLLLSLAMVIVFFIGRSIKMRAPILLSLVVGLVVAGFESKLMNPHLTGSIVHPQWITPTFSIASTLNLALPIFLLVMTTQNATGTAVLFNMKYEAPVNAIVTMGGVLSLLSAGFGGSGVNTAAMTAAIGSGPEADPNPKTRYFAGFVSGVLYMLLGLFASVETGLLAALPVVLVSALAGLALIPTIGSSLHEALIDPEYRDAGLVALLISVSGITFLNVGAPFWGLVGGIVIHQFTLWARPYSKTT